MTCCDTNKEGTRDVNSCECVLLPRYGGLAWIAQILALIAIFFSLGYWFVFLLGIVCMALIQLIYCRRHNIGCLYLYVAIAAVCGLCFLANALFIFRDWRGKEHCWGIMFPQQDNDSLYYDYTNDTWEKPVNDYDGCHWALWGSMNLVGGILWACTALCLCCHTWSGRHEKLQELLYATPEPVAVLEIPTRPSDTPQPQTETVAIQPVEVEVEAEPRVEDAPILSGSAVVLVSEADNKV